jgi:hypothetical protein
MVELLRHRQTKGAENRHAQPTVTAPHLDSTIMLHISEFPAGDFGSIRQAVSVETGSLFRSKAAPFSEGFSVPASANRRW